MVVLFSSFLFLCVGLGLLYLGGSLVVPNLPLTFPPSVSKGYLFLFLLFLFLWGVLLLLLLFQILRSVVLLFFLSIWVRCSYGCVLVYTVYALIGKAPL